MSLPRLRATDLATFARLALVTGIARVIDVPMMDPAEWAESKARTDEEWARVVLPAGWREMPVREGSIIHGARIALRGKTTVVFSAGKYGGQWWLHVSIAHPLKLPTYMDLVELKAVFVGLERQAVQLFAASADHVSIHPRALHLWSCLEPEGDGLPKFGSYGTI